MATQTYRRSGLWFVFLGWLVASFSIQHVSAQEETEKRSFDVSEGYAINTLKEAAQQADVDFIFSADLVKGVRTRSIQGEYSPLEAFSLMLAETSLEVFQHAQSGVYAISKVTDIPTLELEPKPNNETDMNAKKDNWLKSLAAVLTFGIAGQLPPAYGQAENEDDDLFVLNPFTITEEDSVGYQATSTLAGTRIKTALKDIGSSISVVTEEFLEDTGTTTVEDILVYTMGTEIGGPEGNYSGTNVGTSSRFNDDEARRSPQSGARLRGVSSPNYTRNYFSTDIPIEGYNTSGITISRGPNSLLFGLGSPAGVIDNSVKNPTIGADNSELSFRFGSHDSYRATFDTNQTLIEDRLAVKASGLYKDTVYRQDPAHDLEKRAYLAFTAVLLENEGSDVFGETILRANFEVGEGKRTPPASIIPIVAYESFFKPPFDFRPYNGQDYAATGGYEELAANWSKWKLLDTREQPDGRPGFNENQGEEGFFPVYSTPFFFTSATTVYQQDGSISVNPLGGSLQGFTGFPNNQPSTSGIPHRPNLFVNTRAYEEAGQGLGFKAPSISSRDVFDYRNHLITGDLQNVTREFDAETFLLEQSLFEGRGGFELAFDKQFYQQYWHQPFGGGGRASTVYIDTSNYLIDGSVNPNAGRAFLSNYYTFDSETERTTKRENKRATAFYEVDFEDVNEDMGKWLGKHRFTGLWQSEERTILSKDYGKFLDGVGFNIRGGNDRGWGRQVAPIHYISGDLRGVEMEDVRLTQARGDTRDGDRFEVLYFDSPNDVSTLETREVTVNRRGRGGWTNGLEVESQTFAWQSFLAGGHIVGLVGFREDEITSWGQLPQSQVPGGSYNRPGGEFDHSKLILNPAGASSQEGDTSTYSIVGHLPDDWIEGFPLFSSVSGHWSKAENFQAIAVRHDHFNNSIGNPSGETEEYGVTLGFDDDKWLLRINRFETSARDASASGLGGPSNDAIGWIRNIINRWHAGITDEIPFEENSPNVPVAEAWELGWRSYDEIINEIISIIPEPARSIYDYQLADDGTEYEGQDSIQQLSAVQDIASEGYEFELIANPTDNWRIALNATQVEATPTGTAQALQDFSTMVLDGMRSSGLSLLHEGVQSIVNMEERYKNTVAVPVAAARTKDDTRSQELREWRWNVISNYTFNEGRLAGLGIGGAIRYQSSVSTGSALMFDNVGVPVPDLNRLYFGPSEFNGDLWLSYRMKLWDKIDWKIQLNARNLIGDDDDIALYTNPDGTERLFRVAPEKSWFLTNTISF